MVRAELVCAKMACFTACAERRAALFQDQLEGVGLVSAPFGSMAKRLAPLRRVKVLRAPAPLTRGRRFLCRYGIGRSQAPRPTARGQQFLDCSRARLAHDG